MKLAVIFSGGKDSTFAMYKTMKEGHEIVCLLTMIPRKEDSWMFHHPCIELTELQARSMGVKQILQKTSGEKEKELEDLKKVLMRLKGRVDGVVSGALASQYQKKRIDDICKEIGLESLAPLWKKDQEEVLREEASTFDVIITGVAAEGFDESWLGRKIDAECIKDLEKLHKKYKTNWAFEGGEAETFVLDGPIFKERIEIRSFEKRWDSKTNSGYIDVKDVRLVKK